MSANGVLAEQTFGLGERYCVHLLLLNTIQCALITDHDDNDNDDTEQTSKPAHEHHPAIDRLPEMPVGLSNTLRCSLLPSAPNIHAARGVWRKSTDSTA